MTDHIGPSYRYNDQQRAEWIVDILAVADDRPSHRAYALALAEYWATASPGDDSAEPAPESSWGKISWKIECALTADFAAIHQPPKAPGVYGGEYSREYVRLRKDARRAALLAARERRQREERTATETLADLLTVDPGSDGDSKGER